MSEQLPAKEIQEPTAALQWPVWDVSMPIVQHFGDNKKIYNRFGQEGHNGIDLAAYEFTPVKAAANGIVRFAGNGAAEPLMGSAAGECILIRHADGTQTGYAHLSNIYVEEGYVCKAGEVIALSGRTGATTGPHLHFEVLGWPLEIRNGYFGRIDPLPLLGRTQ